MNDRERIISFLHPIQIFLNIHSTPIKEVCDLIGKNQNKPPAGEADGSLTDNQWTAARDAIDMLKNFQTNLEILKR